MIKTLLILLLTAATLSGCVVVPAHPYHPRPVYVYPY
jgi:hypothetical protein